MFLLTSANLRQWEHDEFFMSKQRVPLFVLQLKRSETESSEPLQDE